MIGRIGATLVVSFCLIFGGCEQLNPVGGTGAPTWTQVNTGIWDQNVSHINSVSLFASGSNLFAGTDSGVYLSTDQGAHWSSRNTGLPPGYLRYIRSFAASRSLLFAGASQGVFSSTNDGENWIAATNGLPSTPVEALIVVGSDLLAATSGGVYRSTDNGSTWQASNGGPKPPAILAAFQVQGAKLFAGGYHGIFVSTDQGHHWTLTDSLFAGHRPMVTSFAVSGSNMFVGLYAVGVYVSADTGITWNPCNNGLADFARIRSGSTMNITLWRYMLVQTGKRTCLGPKKFILPDQILRKRIP